MDYIKGGCQISLMVAIDFTVRKRRGRDERERQVTASLLGIKWKARKLNLTPLQ